MPVRVAHAPTGSDPGGRSSARHLPVGMSYTVNVSVLLSDSKYSTTAVLPTTHASRIQRTLPPTAAGAATGSDQSPEDRSSVVNIRGASVQGSTTSPSPSNAAGRRPLGH